MEGAWAEITAVPKADAYLAQIIHSPNKMSLNYAGFFCRLRLAQGPAPPTSLGDAASCGAVLLVQQRALSQGLPGGTAVLAPCGFVEDELSQDLAVCLGLPFISTLNDCCALDPAERTKREGLWWCCWDRQ